jgi:meiotic recombination protein REC8
MLEDDPNFSPELDLLQVNLEMPDLVTDLDSLQDSSQITPEGSQRSHGLDQDLPGALMMMPASASSFPGGPVGGGRKSSVRGDSGAGSRIGAGFFQQDEAHGMLEDDLGMQIDADGNFVLDEDMPTEPIRQPRAPSGPVDRTDLPSESASAHVRAEHADGQQVSDFASVLAVTQNASANDEQFMQPDDGGYVAAQDDGYMVDQNEAAPMPDALEELEQELVASESASADQRRRYRTGPKVIPLDDNIELHNRDISVWNQRYKENMSEALSHKLAHRLVTLAKKNAEHWILGAGNNSLLQADRGPLNMFTGIKLLEAITGLDLTVVDKKRARDEDPASDDGRRVRSRGEPSSDEFGRGFGPQDDGFMPMMDDDTVEQGREQPTPLDDRQLSSLFPWNQSTGSRRPTALFSAGGTSAIGALPLPALSRRGSRLLTASPLLGRGLPAGNDTDYDLNLPGSGAGMDPTAEDEFELFGPAAQVDTQTATESQWVRAALDGESANFLEFVKAGIEELDLERDAAAPGDEEDENVFGCIDFDQLLPPLNNTRVVAAQGLLHVLALVTKNGLMAKQEEAFGPIGLRVIEV